MPDTQTVGESEKWLVEKTYSSVNMAIGKNDKVHAKS
jgi:hypothetical protein